MMKTISLSDIIIFHEKIVQATGGSDGIRDFGLIESALSSAFVTFDGKDLYEDTEDKISAITFALIKNHCFVDGNKRIGVAVMLLLLNLNNINISYSQEELINLGLEIAGGMIGIKEIKRWINNHKI
ncbi:MAG TPA: type II toxin-antitoxin system death-on-curing family toxin [Clostridia bacterium]|nr:type II toxin-antitoxin system death-on-curing family toxin [Clostridia bacterium]